MGGKQKRLTIVKLLQTFEGDFKGERIFEWGRIIQDYNVGDIDESHFCLLIFIFGSKKKKKINASAIKFCCDHNTLASQFQI
jgi:hypothetical protein